MTELTLKNVLSGETSLKAIDKNIKWIASTANKVNDMVHLTALMVMRHAAPKDQGGEGHGDCSRAQALVMALPASFRRTTLIQWFAMFGPIVVKNDEKWNAKMQKPLTALGKPNPLYKPFDLKAAAETPFWKIAEEQREADTKPLTFDDIVKMVERLAAQIEKKIEDGLVADEDMAAAISVAKVVDGLHFTRTKAGAEASVEETGQDEGDDEGEEQRERAA